MVVFGTIQGAWFPTYFNGGSGAYLSSLALGATATLQHLAGGTGRSRTTKRAD